MSGPWKEKGFEVPLQPARLDRGRGVDQSALNSAAMLGWVYLATAFILGAAFATVALWVFIPYLPYAR